MQGKSVAPGTWGKGRCVLNQGACLQAGFRQCEREGAAFCLRSHGPPSEAGRGSLLPMSSAC